MKEASEGTVVTRKSQGGRGAGVLYGVFTSQSLRLPHCGDRGPGRSACSWLLAQGRAA